MVRPLQIPKFQTLPVDDFARRELIDSFVSVGFVDRHVPVDQLPMID
jgi:hypothetical protein